MPVPDGRPSIATAQPERYTLAEQGAYFVAMNAADDTQIVGHVAPAIADTDTKSMIHIFNGGPRALYLDFISIYSILPNTNATRTFFDVYVDNKGSTCKSSGGTVATAVNCALTGGLPTAAVLTAGAVVTAPVSSRKLGHAMVRPAIGIALDQYHFSFGAGLPMSQGAFVQTTVQSSYSAMAPVIVPAGGNFMFVYIGPSGSAQAMSFEYQMGWWER